VTDQRIVEGRIGHEAPSRSLVTDQRIVEGRIGHEAPLRWLVTDWAPGIAGRRPPARDPATGQIPIGGLCARRL